MLKRRGLHTFKILLGTVGAVGIGALALDAITMQAAWAAQGSFDAALSSEASSRALAVSPPMIDAPASVAGVADQALSITATATDPDAGDILTITASGAPASLSLSAPPGITPLTATLSGAPSPADVGVWPILWSVNDGAGGNASTTTELTVGPNHDPVLSAPATVNGAETVAISFAVTASDADGDPITSITSSALPPGATFTVNAFHTVGEFAWTPAVGQQGSYSITFSAASGSPARTATATTALNVGPRDRPPVITAPGTVTARANQLLTVTATASDPDGDAISSFLAQGTQNTQLPAGAVWTVNGTNTAGALTWTPTQAQVGNYGIDFIAFSGPTNLRAVKVTRINVLADRAPVVTAPASVSALEGVALSVTLTASDPDGQAIPSLTATGLPFGATFSAGPGNTSGQLDWTPSFQQAGVYPVLFTATNILSGSATTTISVSDVNREPSANPGGPYSGIVGVPLGFSGSGSSDPDGNALTYAWDFGDGGTASGPTPGHTYAGTGSYLVSLTVTDNGTPALSNTATTSAAIVSELPASVFQQTTGVLKLKNKPRYCFEIEPVGGSYANSDVILTSIVMKYAGRQISADVGRASIDADVNFNGIQEIRACFATANLKSLFAGLPSGDNVVTVAIEGDLSTGGRFRGTTDVTVRGPVSGSALAASVSPNPLNPASTLYFATSKPGSVKVEMFDLQGRLVRTIVTETFMGAGDHEARIDGRGQRGEKLASGVYFVRGVTVDGVFKNTLTILK